MYVCLVFVVDVVIIVVVNVVIIVVVSHIDDVLDTNKSEVHYLKPSNVDFFLYVLKDK